MAVTWLIMFTYLHRHPYLPRDDGLRRSRLWAWGQA